MDLVWVVILVATAVVIALLLSLALMAEGSGEPDAESGVLATLAEMRSPSGRPFFPSPESVQDFLETLTDAHVERSRR